MDYELRISTGYPDYQYALIQGYDGPAHVEDEEAYLDAGFILVGDGGSVYVSLSLHSCTIHIPILCWTFVQRQLNCARVVVLWYVRLPAFQCVF